MLTVTEKQKIDSEIDKMKWEDLVFSERHLIYLIRTRFKFGELRIRVRQGKPEKIIRALEWEDLI